MERCSTTFWKNKKDIGRLMICWILLKNLEDYKNLCHSEGIVPYIMEQTEDKAHVQMTPNMASIWNMVGYWYEMG